MRQPRLKLIGGPDSTFYHCLSRVVDRTFRFGDTDKEQFVSFLREYEAFCGVRVLTYCIMCNHFHILLEIPARPAVLPTAETLIERLKGLSGAAVTPAKVQQRIETFRAAGDVEGERNYLESFFRRMWDLSEFMKLVKQRFSSWFNRTRDRKGTLWEDRFKSIVVEGGRDALVTMAVYIDLNPLRAGMVNAPERYRWCGYAEAMAGASRARVGIQSIAALLTGKEVSGDLALELYRCQLFGQAEECSGTDEQGRPLRRGLTREQVLAVIRNHGVVSVEEYVRCRVKALVDGVALGSRGFVEGIYQRFRGHFGRHRTGGVCGLAGLASPKLFALRQWRQGEFG